MAAATKSKISSDITDGIANGSDSTEDKCQSLKKVEDLENLYLPVYGTVFLADWLQGSYIYALYKSYGYDLDMIAVLFVIGFFSSAISAPFCGKLADKYGRRLACSLFCVFYSVSCLTKLSSHFLVLVFGRVMGGISTSFLHTTFESWLVAQHEKSGLNEASLNRIFGKSTFLNGLMAILSGAIANFSVDRFGVVSPFIESTILLCGAWFYMATYWQENFGNEEKNNAHGGIRAEPQSVKESVQLIVQSSKLRSLAFGQTSFESAMYIFVLLWTPMADEYALDGQHVPYGIVFSCFMLSIMIGSQLFTALVDFFSIKPSLILSLTMYIAGLAMLVLALAKSSFSVFFAFNLFELCCGMYFSSLSAVRTLIIPESCRSTIMNLLRIPMNLVVVAVLLQIDFFNQKFVFCCCCGALFLSGFFVERNIVVHQTSTIDNLPYEEVQQKD